MSLPRALNFQSAVFFGDARVSLPRALNPSARPRAEVICQSAVFFADARVCAEGFEFSKCGIFGDARVSLPRALSFQSAVCFGDARVSLPRAFAHGVLHEVLSHMESLDSSALSLPDDNIIFQVRPLLAIERSRRRSFADVVVIGSWWAYL